MVTERFTTLDVYLAAYLTMNGCQPGLESRGGKVIFVFLQDREVSRIVEQFNSNTLVTVADFTTAIKTLRGRMLQAKVGSR